ncbi:hypothetical protein F4777DRAFT_394675 [Nemania sp. FL0916]|nr:hypothetical protein F4777DRAFT_394675 [Nemania sp. FL0916]
MDHTTDGGYQKKIEPSNFEHIQLTLWRMPEFSLMTERNRALVKCISLALELEGDGGLPWEPELRPGGRRFSDNCIVIKGMHDLLRILSTWKPQGQLQLEIKVCGGASPAMMQDHEDANTLFAKHGLMFFNDACEKSWWETLPEVPAVTGLVIRVRGGRPWKPTTLDNLVSRLPNLEKFHYVNMPEDPITAPHTCDTAIHRNPEYSGKTWAKALAYYRRIQCAYFFEPVFKLYLETEYDPSRRPDADEEQ